MALWSGVAAHMQQAGFTQGVSLAGGIGVWPHMQRQRADNLI